MAGVNILLAESFANSDSNAEFEGYDQDCLIDFNTFLTNRVNDIPVICD